MGTNLGYGIFWELGGTIPARTILPRLKKALYWPGALHPVRSVKHPGSRANPFMERIIAVSQPEIDTMFGTALKQITAAIAAK